MSAVAALESEAVCCDDMEHCCPSGHTCGGGGGTCSRRATGESGRTYFRLSPLYYALFCLEICLHIAPRHCTT
ncbi:unnamed protein product [Boreogadus saida]